MADVVIRHDLPIESEIKQRQTNLEIQSTTAVEETQTSLEDAQVLVVNNETWNSRYLHSLTEGDWIQTTSMGYEAFPIETFQEHGIRFSNAANNYTEVVAEHVFSLLLALSRDLPSFFEGQLNRKWVQDIGSTLSDVAGKHMTIVGLGNIGDAVAKRAQAFKMTVKGTKRSPEKYNGCVPPEDVYSPSGLENLLRSTDYLILTVPLTEKTHHLIDWKSFETLPETAFLINVARGRVVEQQALIRAIRNENINGAGLDVFPEEPLPPDSELWDLDEVIITPHIGGRSETFVSRFVDLFLENYERFTNRMELENQIV